MQKWPKMVPEMHKSRSRSRIVVRTQIKHGGNRVIKIRHLYNKYNETDLRKFTNKAAVDVSTAFTREKENKSILLFDSMVRKCF